MAQGTDGQYGLQAGGSRLNATNAGPVSPDGRQRTLNPSNQIAHPSHSRNEWGLPGQSDSNDRFSERQPRTMSEAPDNAPVSFTPFESKVQCSQAPQLLLQRPSRSATRSATPIGANFGTPPHAAAPPAGLDGPTQIPNHGANGRNGSFMVRMMRKALH